MKRAYKAGKQPILNNKTTTLAVRRYHHHQLSVKKVVKLANQVGQRNLAKNLSGSSTLSSSATSLTSNSSKTHQQRSDQNKKNMMTSVLHMPTGKMPTTTATTAKPVVGPLGTIDCPRGTLQQQHQNTSSPSLNSNSSLPEVARNLAETATNTANTATQQNNSATVKPGLPSPSSTSETSDYQRSTPSPNAGNEDQLRSLGTTEIDWSQNNHPSNDHEQLVNGQTQMVIDQDAKLIQQRRKSTSSLLQNTSRLQDNVNKNNHQQLQVNNQISSSNSNLVLQQLRVALKKLPEGPLENNVSKLTPSNGVTGASLKQPLIDSAVKRRHSDCGLISTLLNSCSSSSSNNDNLPSEVKKAKYLSQPPRRPLSASLHKSGQGKITAYLPEMKHFIALRKEKLDRVLNLATPKVEQLQLNGRNPTSVNRSEVTMQDISSNPTENGKKDSQQPILTNYESGVETGSNDTASVASSGSRHSVSSGISSRDGRGGLDQDQDVFEVPRTIRFPPAAPNKSSSDLSICKWELCGTEFDSTGKLLDHLKSIHAVAENQKEETDNSGDETTSIQYKCLWEGCKVYGKGSSSKLWLEKHVMSHGGNKPFQCIVDGCKHRFGTQTLLERHVNNHFKNKESPSGAVSTTTTTEGGSGPGASGSKLGPSSRSSASNQSMGGNGCTSAKVFKKLNKRLKYRQIVYSARIFDHFDIGSMAQIRMRLSEYEKKCQEWKTLGFLENPHLVPQNPKISKIKQETTTAPPQTNSADQVVILHSKIIAKKTDLQGNLKVLQSWNPPNIMEDQWILAKDVVPTKSVKMSSLPLSARVQLTNQMYNLPPPSSTQRRGRKLKPQPRSTALS